MKLPTTIGATIDLLYKLGEQRKEQEAELKKLKEQEKAIELHLLNNFQKSEINGARGKLAQFSVGSSVVADVTDWDALWKYITKNKAYDMVQKRVSVTACRARWDNKKQIPGVDPQEIVTFSLRKI